MAYIEKHSAAPMPAFKAPVIANAKRIIAWMLERRARRLVLADLARQSPEQLRDLGLTPDDVASGEVLQELIAERTQNW